MIKVADITVLATAVLGGGERCYLLFEQQEGGTDFRWPLNDEYTI